jgi:hypothetical protein
MKSINELLQKENVCMRPEQKEKLGKTLAGDAILLQGKTPSKAYIVIKIALVDLSDKLKQETDQLFGESTDQNFKQNIKKQVMSKLEKNKSLTESFSIQSSSVYNITKGVHNGVLSVVIESMFPFTERINALQDPKVKQCFEQTYSYLKLSLISEIRRLGVFDV